MQLEKSFGGLHRVARVFIKLPSAKFKHDLINFIVEEATPAIQRQLARAIRENPGQAFKFHIELQVEFSKIIQTADGLDERRAQPYFKSDVSNLLASSQTHDLTDHFQQIMNSLESFNKSGSGFNFVQVLILRLYLSEFTPFGGGCMRGGTKLPERIRTKHATISPPPAGDLDTCFRDCVLLAEKRSGGFDLRNMKLTPKKLDQWNALSTTFDFSDVAFPTPIGQLAAFERRNPHVAVNVYGLNNEKTGPPLRIFYLSKNVTNNPTENQWIDLLLYKKHYYLITDLSRLIGKQGVRKKHICHACLCSFSSPKRLWHHMSSVCPKKTPLLCVPLQKTTVKFQNYTAQVPKNFVVYYDTETIQKDEGDGRRKHIPVAIAAKRICAPEPKFNSPLFWSVGTNCVDKFLDWLEGQSFEMRTILNTTEVPIQMTAADWQKYHQTTNCEMCGLKFSGFDAKYKDHCHLSGKLRFILCNTCNLTYAATKKLGVPVVAHGAVRFDQHFLVHKLAERCRKRSENLPRILPRNTEHYLALYTGDFKFQDSLEFLCASLSSVVESMKRTGSTVGGKSEVAFPLLREFVNGDEEKYELLSRKGVFCYDFLDSEEKLNLPRLPDKEHFYDSLKDVAISDEDYRHAQHVWTKLGCKTLQDYLLVYLFSDVLLLADCFERFRKLSSQHFQLDAANFLTLPHFAFHAMLKTTKIDLEALPDIEMYHMVKKAVRGGVASIMHRYAKANIPELVDTYDPNLPESHIVALDCVNLYGHALSRVLPHKNYAWLTRDEIKKLDVTSIPDDADTGYFLCVDLEYPAELHDQHSDYPLAPHHRAVPPIDWSPYTHRLVQDLEDSGFYTRESQQVKLIPDLTNRENYVVHYQSLKFYLKCGMKLKKIHRVLAFKQSPWMREFVEFVTGQRKRAVSDFEGSFWKLVLNSIYGRMLMDKTAHVNMKLVADEKVFKSMAGKPNYKSSTIYSQTLAGVQMNPTHVRLDQPEAVGAAVLDLSKLHMYRFYFNFALPTLGGVENCRLLMTDTDSLVFWVKNIDPKTTLAQTAPQFFDLSNFPPTHPLYNPINKKAKGSFKIEYAQQTITAFVGLRAKMYCFQFESDERLAKAKGIPASALKRVQFEHYYNALFHPRNPQPRARYKAIRSKKLQLYTIDLERKGLSCIDLKRFVLDDGVSTLAYGHYRCGEKHCERVDNTALSETENSHTIAMATEDNKQARSVVTIELSSHVNVNVGRWNGQTWFHFRRSKPDNAVSLNMEEMRVLFSQKDSLKSGADEVCKAEEEADAEQKKAISVASSSSSDDDGESSEYPDPPSAKKQKRKKKSKKCSSSKQKTHDAKKKNKKSSSSW